MFISCVFATATLAATLCLCPFVFVFHQPPLTALSSCSLSIISARGDRMKQAQVDADELIAAYRLEQQDAFDKKANADGKSIKC